MEVILTRKGGANIHFSLHISKIFYKNSVIQLISENSKSSFRKKESQRPEITEQRPKYRVIQIQCG